MNLFFTPDLDPTAKNYALDTEESRHAVGVLRLRVGDTINLTNGRGCMFEARITIAEPKSCVVEITECLVEYGKRNYRLHVALAPTKNIDRYEWFLEKATEVGVDRLTPLLVARSERKVVKYDRSLKVVQSASKQSLKAYVPQLDELTPFADFMKQDFGAAKKYIAYCSNEYEKLEFSKMVVNKPDTVILIGPEGDFAPAEVALALERGFVPVSLGRSRLRTETAGVSVAVMAAVGNVE